MKPKLRPRAARRTAQLIAWPVGLAIGRPATRAAVGSSGVSVYSEIGTTAAIAMPATLLTDLIDHGSNSSLALYSPSRQSSKYVMQ